MRRREQPGLPLVSGMLTTNSRSRPEREYSSLTMALLLTRVRGALAAQKMQVRP
jgi:hypothetical protein